MGRMLLLMSTRPCFLSIGCTKGYFQSLVRYPVSKYPVSILVIIGTISSRHTDRRDAGIGSSGNDFLFSKAEILDSTPSVLSVELVLLSSIPRIPNFPNRNLLESAMRITLHEARLAKDKTGNGQTTNT